jgi:hypothetical protein
MLRNLFKANPLTVGVGASALVSSFQDCKNIGGAFLVKDTSSKCGPQTRVSVELNSLSQSISNSIKNIISSTTSNIATFQSQYVNITGNCCSNIDINQSTNVTLKGVANLSATDTENIITTIKNKIMVDLEQISKQVNDVLNSGTSGTTTLDIKQMVQDVMISNTMKNAVTTAISNIALGQTQTVNIVCPLDTTKNIDYRGSDNVCRVNQDLIANIQADVIINTVFDVLRRDEIIKEAQYKIQQVAETENRGLTNIVDSVVDFFKSLNMMIIVVVLGAILLLPVGLMVWKKMKSKGGVSEAAIAQFLRSARRGK